MLNLLRQFGFWCVRFFINGAPKAGAQDYLNRYIASRRRSQLLCEIAEAQSNTDLGKLKGDVVAHYILYGNKAMTKELQQAIEDRTQIIRLEAMNIHPVPGVDCA